MRTKTTEALRSPKMGRRDFLKGSGKILPALAIIGLAIVAPLSAQADCNNSCEGSCYDGCKGSCMDGCTGSCKEGCTGSCMEGCTGGSK